MNTFGKLNLRWFVTSVVTLLLALLVACASHGQELIFHGIAVVNKSSVLVQTITVAYGKEIIQFSGKYRPIVGGTGSYGEMPVASAMTVEWHTADGQTHTQTMPIKLKNATARSLEALEIQFTDTGLELYQGIRVDKYSRDYTRIFP